MSEKDLVLVVLLKALQKFCKERKYSFISPTEIINWAKKEVKE